MGKIGPKFEYSFFRNQITSNQLHLCLTFFLRLAENWRWWLGYCLKKKFCFCYHRFCLYRCCLVWCHFYSALKMASSVLVESLHHQAFQGICCFFWSSFWAGKFGCSCEEMLHSVFIFICVKIGWPKVNKNVWSGVQSKILFE